ncbi:hypothetical protein F511_22047 [Dorcoceras hygrometricum]|uniref:Uncharacterized protein n=1 Tax=Dorcoceras hygrometricum TaxID=472368 RepID=A0A2Z7AFY4_9LAMI|nr:hypothetical protein F511_22047 [Dorcoceras hygrometricum]
MSSIDDRAVVDFVQSLGSPSSSGTISTSTVPDKVSRRELLARINIEEATLLAEGRPWYEIKASLLQESDKALIRDLSDMSDQYDILIPLPEDQAHLPPEGYHIFYINQLEMGLRFPVPRFIQSLCDHLRIAVDTTPIRSMTRTETPSSGCTRSTDEFCTNGLFSSSWPETNFRRQRAAAATAHGCGGGGVKEERRGRLASITLDAPVVSSASDKKITEALASNFLQGGELSRRVTKAREVAHSSKRSLNDVMAKHDKLMKELEEVRGASDVEKKSLEQKLTASEASIIRLQEEMKKAG